jgi:hypothetical protein
VSAVWIALGAAFIALIPAFIAGNKSKEAGWHQQWRFGQRRL